MPGLLTLNTNLKSLKYGQDQPGGGSSKEPYIKVDINSVDATFNKVRLTKFDDGLVRGGVIGAINASVVDTLRISKFFTDFPKGPLFLTKQVGLQLSNPQLEHKNTLPTNLTGTNRPTKGQGLRNISNAVTNAVTAVGAFISNTANRIENSVGPTRIYNLGVNTLAQIPVNAIGGHIVRHGFLPTEDPSKYYEAVVTQNNFQNNHNRLEEYASNFSLGGMDTILNKTNYNTDTLITSYIGGPSSVYGIGQTFIRRWTNTNDKFKIEFSKNQSHIFAGRTRGDNNDVKEIEFELDRLLGVSNQTGSIFSLLGNTTPPLSNNDNNIPVNLKDNIAKSTDISLNQFTNKTDSTKLLNVNDTLENVVNSIPGPSSYPGADANDTSNKDGVLNQLALAYDYGTNPALRTYAKLQSQISSSITQQTPNGIFKTKDTHIHRGAPDYKYNSGKLKYTEFNRINDTVEDKDTLALVFNPINPFTGLAFKPALKFLAYITDYSDTFDSTWNDVKYVGRAEKFYIFNEFKRSISLGFNIPCFNKEELVEKHNKLNKLASILAGKYENGLLGGVITRLKVGNYIANQPGIITNLNFSPIQDASWDLDSKLAFYIKVSFNFTVIHDKLPQYDVEGTGPNNIFIKSINEPPPPTSVSAGQTIDTTFRSVTYNGTTYQQGQ